MNNVFFFPFYNTDSHSAFNFAVYQKVKESDPQNKLQKKTRFILSWLSV
jgi:hypothetical protein